MTVEPMTDADMKECLTQAIAVAGATNSGYVRLEWFEAAWMLSHATRLEAELDAERSRADAAEAERDAAVEEQRILSKEIVALRADLDAVVARAMPGWRYLATWDAVNTVEARHNDEPAPGLYAIWKPGWPYPSAASVQFGVFATDEESPAPDDYLLGAWISGPLPLPDLPTPTAGETP